MEVSFKKSPFYDVVSDILRAQKLPGTYQFPPRNLFFLFGNHLRDANRRGRNATESTHSQG